MHAIRTVILRLLQNYALKKDCLAAFGMIIIIIII